MKKISPSEKRKWKKKVKRSHLQKSETEKDLTFRKMKMRKISPSEK